MFVISIEDTVRISGPRTDGKEVTAESASFVVHIIQTRTLVGLKLVENFSQRQVEKRHDDSHFHWTLTQDV